MTMIIVKIRKLRREIHLLEQVEISTYVNGVNSSDVNVNER